MGRGTGFGKLVLANNAIKSIPFAGNTNGIINVLCLPAEIS